MNTKDCLSILREIKDVAFATVDEKGEPQVRIIDIMLIEDEKLYFCTARGKDFYRELTANPKIAITGMNREYQMVRLSGNAKKLPESKKWIDRIFKENLSMNGVYPDNSRYILEPFCIEDGWIEFFDLGKTPIDRKSFAMGNAKEKNKGFYISDECIGCLKCKNVCPQNCIEERESLVIIQEHCLHCGLCNETCPVKAVKRREL